MRDIYLALAIIILMLGVVGVYWIYSKIKNAREIIIYFDTDSVYMNIHTGDIIQEQDDDMIKTDAGYYIKKHQPKGYKVQFYERIELE